MKKIAVLFFAATSLAAFAYVTNITEQSYVWIGVDEDTLSVADYEVVDPATIDAPQFWLDASDASGWTIEEGNVKRIPSKTGNKYLVCEKPQGYPGEVLPPKMVASDGESAMPCLDFGEVGSKRGMIFDGGAIGNIGTVIAVCNAGAYGGWLFSGPYTGDAIWTWKRGNFSFPLSDITLDYRQPLCNAQNANRTFTSSLFCQNGLPYIGASIGFSGQWEVFSMSPTNSTLLSACGIGLGSMGGTGAESGGIKYAELLIYDRLLDSETVKKIERFLARKWGLVGDMFICSDRAYVDALSISSHKLSAISGQVDVDAGKTMYISTVRGGRNSNLTTEPKLIKTGQGTLEVGDFSRYGGTLELREGNLAFNLHESKSDTTNNFVFPAGKVCHFDVSRADKMVLATSDGVDYLERLYDVDETGLYHLRSQGVTTNGNQRPWISSEYISPTGIAMLDFGPAGSWGTYYSTMLDFYCGDEEGNNAVFTTIIAAVGTQRGGGWLSNNGFQRANTIPQFSTGLLCSKLADSTGSGLLSDAPALSATNGVAYVDGRRIEDPYRTGYPDMGYHVVALQIPGSIPTHVGGYWNRVGGGLILGEYLAWNRPLSKEEILKVQNYLSLKWMGKALDGPVNASECPVAGVPAVQKIRVDGASTITVNGKDVHIAKLEVNAPLVKNGKGTLIVNELTGSALKNLKILEGEIANGFSPALNSDGTAQAPSLRLDMANTNGWVFAETDGTKYLQRVEAEGVADITVKQSTSSRQPFVNDDVEFVAKAGVPALDFGEESEGRFLGFDKTLESIRSVYMVWKLKPNSGTFLLGTSYTTMDKGTNSVQLAGYIYDFHRGYSPGSDCHGGSMFHAGNAAAGIRNGEVFTNGVQIAADKITLFKPIEDEWQLVEVHTTAGVSASAIASDRNFQYYGNMAMAELIVYERELTEREKVSTRNYLLKKWFGKNDAELAPLPEDEVLTLELPVLAVDGVAEIAAANVKVLEGNGKLVKTGDGELSLLNVNSYSGSMVVEQGSVNFKGEYRAEPKMATNGLRMRLAADEGLKLIDNSDGTRGVLEWANTVEDDWKAVAPTGYIINAEKSGNISKLAPLYVENSELNGLPVVDMPTYRCFRFIDSDGNYASVKEIRNVFWVVGSQRGGGWLLGGGNLDSSNFNAKYIAWHRGGNANNEYSSGTTHIDWLIGGSAYTSVQNNNNCVWRKNSQTVSPRNEPLSGGWDQLTYSALATIETEAKEYPGASGLAFDGRIFDGNPVNIAYSSRAGNQTLAEVLIYTNALTEAEILQTEAYLNCKWGLNNAIVSNAYDFSLAICEGAEVKLADYSVFEMISGAGTVNGDISVRELAADFLKKEFFTVNGVFTLSDGQKITIKNLPQELPAEMKLLQATAIEGAQLRRNIVVAGVDDGKVKVKLLVRDGALYARANAYNMVIVVR